MQTLRYRLPIIVRSGAINDSENEQMELRKGQVAVVTGGASGIGLALAESFARAGLSIVLADVQADALAAAETRIRALGVEVLSVQTDVSKEAEVQTLAAAVIERAVRAGAIVIAEGVETDEQRRVLTGLGCDAAQGPLIGDQDPELTQPALAVYVG